jgi:hypothetical protein
MTDWFCWDVVLLLWNGHGYWGVDGRDCDWGGGECVWLIWWCFWWFVMMWCACVCVCVRWINGTCFNSKEWLSTPSFYTHFTSWICWQHTSDSPSACVCEQGACMVAPWWPWSLAWWSRLGIDMDMVMFITVDHFIVTSTWQFVLFSMFLLQVTEKGKKIPD